VAYEGKWSLGKLFAVLLLPVVFVVGFLLRGWLVSTPSERPVPSGAAAGEGSEQQDGDAEQAAEVKWWTCAMHPQIKKPGPGRCPICSMELVPVVAETGGEPGGGLRRLTVSESAKKLMDVQVAPVERRFATARVRMVGKVEYDETAFGYITAWVPGRIDRLFVDYTGIDVKKGDHMAELYSPDLLETQKALLAALRAVEEVRQSDLPIMRQMTQADVQSVRERLRLWGISDEQVRDMEEKGILTDHVTINAPMGGVVIQKNVQEGMYVTTGTRIYTIADLSQVWVKLDAYESDLIWLRYGQGVRFTTEAYPGETFIGRVAFIDPFLNEKTRTVKVRVNVANPDRKLKPGMFVRAEVRAKVAMGGRVMDPGLADKWICRMHPEVVSDEPGDCSVCGMPLESTLALGYLSASEADEAAPLVIPVTAALKTGTRAIVYVEVPGAPKPTFEGREVVLGPRVGDYYIVRRGLAEGELVVAHGNFKIDSALQIQAKPSMMTPEGGGAGGMHQHGGDSAPKAGAAEEEPGTMAMAPAVPAEVLEQLYRVDEACREVVDALKSEDLGLVRRAYTDLGKAVEAVAADRLSGHARMLWEELAMLLGNDAFEGGTAERFEQAGEVAVMLEGHARRLREQFGLTAERRQRVATAAATRFRAPVRFREQLGTLWQAYQGLHQALAEDDLTAAKSAVGAVENALGGVDMGLLEQAGHMAWMKQVSPLQNTLEGLKGAAELETVRRGFAELSGEMERALRAFGKEPAGPVYKIHCPMAFGGKGAYWLQAEKGTRNPYLGPSMSACGTLVGTLEPPALPPPPGGTPVTEGSAMKQDDTAEKHEGSDSNHE